MTKRSLQRGVRKSIRSPRRVVAALLVVAAVAIASALAFGGSASGSGQATPQRGGTLRLLGTSDIFNLDTTSGYYTVLTNVSRAFTRQLVTFPSSNDFLKEIKVVPDVATSVPTTGNGGITGGGKTYTFHLRKGVKWDTSPARQVTAADFVREFKMLCNPASPTAAPGYFTSTIVGMKAYCDGFAKVKGTRPGALGDRPAVSSSTTIWSLSFIATTLVLPTVPLTVTVFATAVWFIPPHHPCKR